MKRPSSAIYALLVAGIFIWLAVSENQMQKEAAALRAAREKDAQFAAARIAAAEKENEEKLDPATIAAAAAPAPALLGVNRFLRMADGRAVPPLPSEAPQRVKLGLVIFRYKGAQAPPASERSKDEALALAKKAIETAREDFAQAVDLGDSGSDENLGWMGRGVLEPTVEFAVFSLGTGAVSEEPIDTPRGYWVVKRLR